METDTAIPVEATSIPVEATDSFVYLLVAYTPEDVIVATYVGATKNVDRRLRQHNKEITGGARATGARVSQGCIWKRHCYVSGFPTWNAALQFEWRWKQLTRKQKPSTPPLERRLDALNTLLAMERPTTKAVAYSEWPSPPVIIWE
jgi:structure-specific endonuclease subunit SLX1